MVLIFNIKKNEVIFITKLISYDNYNSFSGCDVVVSAQMAPINNGNTMKTHVLGSLQTISYSTHQDRAPVRSIGNINAIDYVQGQRTVAGTMVFAMFHEHWMIPLLKELSTYVTNTDIWSDELPALNLTISMANEYGYKSNMVIYGVKFIDDGGVMSINDLYTENTLQYVATGIQPLRTSGEYQHDYKTKTRPFKISNTSYSRSWSWSGMNTYEKEWAPNYKTVTVDNTVFSPKKYVSSLNATLDSPVAKHKEHDFVVKIASDDKYEHQITNMFLVDTKTNESYTATNDPIHNIWALEVPEGMYNVGIQDSYGNVFNEIWSIDVSDSNNQHNVYVNNNKSNNKYNFSNSTDVDAIYEVSLHNIYKDCPIICEVGDTNMKILLNNNYDYVVATRLKEGNENNLFIDESTDEILKYKISTNISIGQSNNKEILIENLKPNTKYSVCGYNSQTENKSEKVTVKTFSDQYTINNMLKKYITTNTNILINKDLPSYDFNLNKYEYNNIIDAIVDLEDNDKKTELLFYAVKLQNELNKSFNDSGVKSVVDFDDEGILTSNFVIDDPVDFVVVFKKIKSKNYYISKDNPSYNYQYIGKPNIHYFLQPILKDNKKSSRVDFVCFTDKQQELLKKYIGNNLSDLTFLDQSYTYNNYNSKLKSAIKAANNLILYKDILNAPYAKLYNDTLVVDVNYAENNKEDSLYLCIATPENAISNMPIRKIEFKNKTTLYLEKYDSCVLKNNYYLLWIQDKNFNNISPAFILSTYNNDTDINDYYYNKCKSALHTMSILFSEDSVYKKYFVNAVNTLLAEDDLKYKDFNYRILQTIFILYIDTLTPYSVDDIIFSVINTCFPVDKTITVKAKKDCNMLSFSNSNNVNTYISCVTITQNNIIKNSLLTYYDVDLYNDGYTLLSLMDSSYNYTFGYILINNVTKEIYVSNIELEVENNDC